MYFLIGYYSPQNNINLSYSTLYNDTIFQKKSIPQESRLWLPLNDRSKRSYSSRKIRHSWLFIEKPVNTRRW